MMLCFRGRRLLCALGVFGAGCGSGSTAAEPLPHPTTIAVSPDVFLGSLTCGSASGDVVRYVATLFDQTPTGDPTHKCSAPSMLTQNFELPSSSTLEPDASGQSVYKPIPCGRTAIFGWVAPNHFYSARIDAYDRDDLVLLSPGVPIVLAATTREPVAPRWTKWCEQEPPDSSGCCTPNTSSRPMDADGGVIAPTNYDGTKPVTCGVFAEYDLTRTIANCGAWLPASP